MEREQVVRLAGEVLENWDEKDHPRGEDGKFAGNGEGHRTPKEVQAIWDKEKEQRKKKGAWSGFTRMAKEEQSKGSWVNYYSAYAREKEKEKINEAEIKAIVDEVAESLLEGGPGSGRYPAGSGKDPRSDGEKSVSQQIKDKHRAESGKQLDRAVSLSHNAYKSGSKEDHERAGVAHGAYASMNGGTLRGSVHRDMADRHYDAAKGKRSKEDQKKDYDRVKRREGEVKVKRDTEKKLGAIKEHNAKMNKKFDEYDKKINKKTRAR